MTAEPLNKDLAYDSLVDLIVRGEINETETLSERSLSERLGFGRTPIREAIKDLVREGVLESHPVRGTVLKGLDLTDLQDLYEIRFAIEGLAVFLAAERGPVEELYPIRDLLTTALREPGSVSAEEIHAVGVECHYIIVRLSGNARLVEMYRPFRIRFGGPFVLTPQSSRDRIVEAAREHLDIISAVIGRQPEEARNLMCSHLRIGLEHRTNLLLKRSRYPQVVSTIR